MNLTLKTFICIVAISACAARPVPAQQSGRLSASERFDAAHLLLQQAEKARDANDYVEAIQLFEDAYALHRTLVRDYPSWQPQVTQFRMNYCNEQRQILQKRSGNLIRSRQRAGASATRARKDRPSLAENRTPLDSRGSRQASSLPPAEMAKRDARSLIAAGDAEKARALLIRELRRNPDDFQLRLLMATAQVHDENYEDALFLLEELSIELSNNTDVMILLAAVHFAQGEIEDARAALRHVIDIDPKLPEAHFNLAGVLLYTTPPALEEARKHYRLALALGAAPDPGLESRLENP